MPYLSARDGVKLHYAIHDYTDPWKPAPVLILQHGFGRTGRLWFNMIPYLSRFYRVICPDMRGVGDSARDFDLQGGLTLDILLNDILDIAGTLGIDSFHFAGEAFGGTMGLILAARYPDRIRTVGLMSAPLSIDRARQTNMAYGRADWQEAMQELGSRGWGAAMYGADRFPKGTDQAMLDWYANEFGKTAVEFLIALSHVTPNVDTRPLLHLIRAPVLGLYPTGGHFTTGGEEATLRESIADLRLIHLPAKLHVNMTWITAPAICADHLLHFMAADDGIACRE